MSRTRSRLGSRTADVDVLGIRSECREAEVLEARTPPEAPSTLVTPVPTVGPVTIKTPVLLAQLTMQIDLDASIRLPDPATDILRIDKTVFLDQCDLLMPTNRLFVRGRVREDIQYGTASRVTRRAVSGDVRHTIVDVPFESVTAVTFLAPPIEPAPEIYEEFQMVGRFGRPLRETDSITIVDYDSKPFCELVSAAVLQADVPRLYGEGSSTPLGERDSQAGDPPIGERSFRTFREQMMVLLTIQVLQRQLVLDPAPPVGPTPTPTPTPTTLPPLPPV
ncbi:CsxC family protein [Kyrpidia sp.]|uniref:CsxC family protein n=1 Tax=Kyrpidia sp. TaxID=2073077 RepID=UPI002587AA15|nr:hypothetical protein [Kyrpidia sp.]MCL6575848.1 hypothetical protein [Kyrpidia sp.]